MEKTAPFVRLSIFGPAPASLSDRPSPQRAWYLSLARQTRQDVPSPKTLAWNHRGSVELPWWCGIAMMAWNHRGSTAALRGWRLYPAATTELSERGDPSSHPLTRRGDVGTHDPPCHPALVVGAQAPEVA